MGHFTKGCYVDKQLQAKLGDLRIPPPSFSPHTTSSQSIVALGTRVMFHSAIVFIRLSGLVLSFCTASVICLSIASFLKVPVTFILNSCIVLPWKSLQCLHKGEFFTLRLFRSLCFDPLVYPLLADSPL